MNGRGDYILGELAGESCSTFLLVMHLLSLSSLLFIFQERLEMGMFTGLFRTFASASQSKKIIPLSNIQLSDCQINIVKWNHWFSNLMSTHCFEEHLGEFKIFLKQRFFANLLIRRSGSVVHTYTYKIFQHRIKWCNSTETLLNYIQVLLLNILF